MEIPLPLEPIKTNQLEDRRLWVGNLDLCINEYHLLKLAQKYGNIEKFDLLFHRSGPQAGYPRGYAFITYKTVKEAEEAKNALHNLKVGSKSIVVRWARGMTETCNTKANPVVDIPALAGAKKEEKKISRETTIQAIEAKLKAMGEAEEEFKLNKCLEERERDQPVFPRYQKPENQKPSTSSRYLYSRGYSNKPYDRSHSRR